MADPVSIHTPDVPDPIAFRRADQGDPRPPLVRLPPVETVVAAITYQTDAEIHGLLMQARSTRDRTCLLPDEVPDPGGLIAYCEAVLRAGNRELDRRREDDAELGPPAEPPGPDLALPTAALRDLSRRSLARVRSRYLQLIGGLRDTSASDEALRRYFTGRLLAIDALMPNAGPRDRHPAAEAGGAR